MIKKQIGGNHYAKHNIQPWDVVDEYSLNYYEGNIIKYILRHRDKNGVEDLKKAMHYLEKLISDESCNDGVCAMPERPSIPGIRK